VKEMQGSFIFSDKAVKSGSMNLHSWIRKASKEERIELARQIASTVETSEDEIEYINTANLQDMHREERVWIAKKIVSTIPHDWGYTSC
jgi:hypothetical protein